MNYYVGIDGGGTKTDFLCMDSTGRVMADCRLGGSFYRQDGIARVSELIERGVAEVTKGNTPASIVFGMPGLGESPTEDGQAVAHLRKRFPGSAFMAANDVEVGFNGAFAGGCGILIVGGTGSMAWGRDASGRSVRCGGWSETFGDEGSGYWLGRKALEMFSKQSDGRLRRTEIYGMVRETFGLGIGDSDYLLIDRAEREYTGNRERMASLSRLIFSAAAHGDRQARQILAEAAGELAGIVCAVERQLRFDGPVPVAYVGGLFSDPAPLLEPMKKLVAAELEAEFIEPRLSPCEGAVLMAARAAGDRTLERALTSGKV